MSRSRIRSLADRLPGDPDPATEIERMIRVDHAGEFGAVQIYRGQLAVLGHKDTEAVRAIRHMEEQEQEHLRVFDDYIVKEGVRPTALSPIWKRAGFALGAVTALMGEKAAMACTEAVETVIDEHYQEQADKLGDERPELKKIIKKFQAEEVEHREAAIDFGSEEAPGYKVLKGAVMAGSRLAIAIAKRV